MAWDVKFDGNSLTLTVAKAPITNQFYNADRESVELTEFLPAPM